MPTPSNRSVIPFLFLLAALPPFLVVSGHAAEGMADPFLGQPDAIAAGRDIYASKCYVCHHSAGGRGPNLFSSKLNDERFFDTVAHGRKGTQMPAFGQRLSPDEIWQLHAFVKSTDHY